MKVGTTAPGGQRAEFSVRLGHGGIAIIGFALSGE